MHVCPNFPKLRFFDCQGNSVYVVFVAWKGSAALMGRSDRKKTPEHASESDSVHQSMGHLLCTMLEHVSP